MSSLYQGEHCLHYGRLDEMLVHLEEEVIWGRVLRSQAWLSWNVNLNPVSSLINCVNGVIPHLQYGSDNNHRSFLRLIETMISTQREQKLYL
jgi:hypothetical protein